jgi:inhibitor of KinA sporulation pathway (predicted exonuclease)
MGISGQGLDCADNQSNLNNMQQRVVDCVGVFPAVFEESRQYFRQHHPRPQSVDIIISITCGDFWKNTYRRSQVKHCLPGYEGLFMIVLDLHIDDMYNAIKFTPS